MAGSRAFLRNTCRKTFFGYWTKSRRTWPPKSPYPLSLSCRRLVECGMVVCQGSWPCVSGAKHIPPSKHKANIGYEQDPQSEILCLIFWTLIWAKVIDSSSGVLGIYKVLDLFLQSKIGVIMGMVS